MNDVNTNVQHDKKTTLNLWIFAAALAILLILAVVFFGVHILLLTAVSFAVALLVEFAFAKGRKLPFDKEWMITPLVVVLILPPAVPAWLVGIATFFAVFFGKNIFGGSGKYIFFPALVGALFVLISFPVQMATSWQQPGSDIMASATPLLSLNRGVTPYPFTLGELLLGQAPGSTGEIFRLGVIVLGLLLFILKVRDWKATASYLGVFFVLTAFIYFVFPDAAIARDPIISLLSGGILFGAFFIASDPVLQPQTSFGKVLYGVGLALLTFVIRNFATFAEGVTFTLIIMSAISPLIDNVTVKKVESEAVEA